ncbi:MAG: tyrosine-type recombinase/integrase [Methanomicrobiales archaeon]
MPESDIPRRAPRREDKPFYKDKPEYADHTLNRALEEGQILREDHQLIRLYTTELKATEGICDIRERKLIYILTIWRTRIGPYTQNTILDLYAGIERIKEAKTRYGTPYTQNSLRDHIGLLKRFYTWLIENSYSSVSLEKLRKIKVPAIDNMTVTADELITRDEIKAMIQHCLNSRDRAMIAVLYEGGFRIGDIGGLTWNMVKFDEYGAQVNVDFKTGIPRYVRLLIAVPYLSAWKNDYPFPIEPEGLVFVSNRNTPTTYAGLSAQIKKIAKRAGIQKAIHPHLFKHTRVTHMHEEGYHDSTIKQICWGHQGTKMLATYAHLTNKTIDDEIFTIHGIKRTKDTEASSMAARQCLYCNTINAPTQEFCNTCGRPLTGEATTDLSTAVTAIEDHPVYKAIMEKIKMELPALAKNSTS